jgi:signal transduction histidine kinase
MWFIKKKEIKQLSNDVRKIIDGHPSNLLDNSEGLLAILKNDIHTLASKLSEQADTLSKDKKAMSEAITDISHQLKTPLTSAIMMSELLENDTLAENKKQEFQENLSLSLKRMEWLISLLLKFARLDSGTIQFESENISCSDLINKAIEPLCLTQKLDVQIADFGLICDINWTAECLTNIIKNASEHSPENGTITIENSENRLYKWISVSDSGEGIAKEQLPTIFDRFKTANKKGGIGVGLNMARTIMRRQGNDIEVNLPNIFTLKFYKK